MKEEAPIKLMESLQLRCDKYIPMEIDDKQSFWNPIGIVKLCLDQNNNLNYEKVIFHTGELMFDSNIILHLLMLNFFK